MRKPTTIWAVRAGDGIYARAAYGSDSGWHRVARTSREASIWASGVQKDVTIEDVVDENVNDRVDAG